MSHLIGLRRHIKSIQTTKKTTYAMRLIAMSTYAKLEHYNAPLGRYQAIISNLLTTMARNHRDWQNPLLFPTDPLNIHPLYIVVASSKGLCGGFNNNLFRFLQQHCFVEEHQQASFIVVGSKAIASLEQEYGKDMIIMSHEQVTINNLNIIAQSITQHIAEHRNYSSITAFSNYFQSFFLQRAEKTVLTPLTTLSFNEENDEPSLYDEPIWEQDPFTILDALGMLHLKSSILHILYQSLLAEQASRFLAMDNATTNAEHMLERLTLEYNKSRQNLITRELAELTASFSQNN